MRSIAALALFTCFLFCSRALAEVRIIGNDSEQGSSTGIIVTSGPEDTLYDHQARVFGLKGKSTLLKKGEEEWASLHSGDRIVEGDQVRTDDDAYALISFDDFYLNTVRIEAHTLAEFRAIEPTDIYLSDGGIFNQLEGLPKDVIYTIATPTAVASARGTSFLREFDAKKEFDNTEVVDGTIEMAPLDEKGKADWNQKVQVGSAQALKFDRKVFSAQKDFRQFQPLPMPDSRKAKLMEIQNHSQEELSHFAGGRENVRQAQARWQEIRQDPERMKKIAEGMQPFNRRFFTGERAAEGFPGGGPGPAGLPAGQTVGPLRGKSQESPGGPSAGSPEEMREKGVPGRPPQPPKQEPSQQEPQQPQQPQPTEPHREMNSQARNPGPAHGAAQQNQDPARHEPREQKRPRPRRG